MNKRSKRKIREEKKEADISTAMISSFYGLGMAMITAVILTFLLSAISLLCRDPGEVAKISGYAVLFISSFVGGFMCCKHCGKYPLVCGIAFAVIYLLIHWLLSLLPIFSESALSFGSVWILRLIALGVAVGGAFFGTYKPKKRHKPKRKR
jgi:putative membrane protein (TIGR04086 family)